MRRAASPSATWALFLLWAAAWAAPAAAGTVGAKALSGSRRSPLFAPAEGAGEMIAPLARLFRLRDPGRSDLDDGGLAALDSPAAVTPLLRALRRPAAELLAEVEEVLRDEAAGGDAAARLELLRMEVRDAARAAAPEVEAAMRRRARQLDAAWRSRGRSPGSETALLLAASEEMRAYSFYGAGAREIAGAVRDLSRRAGAELADARGAQRDHVRRQIALSAQRLREIGGRDDGAAWSALEEERRKEADRLEGVPAWRRGFARRDLSRAVRGEDRARFQGRAASAALDPAAVTLRDLRELASLDASAPAAAAAYGRLLRATPAKERKTATVAAAAGRIERLSPGQARRLAGTPGLRAELMDAAVRRAQPAPPAPRYAEGARWWERGQLVLSLLGLALLAGGLWWWGTAAAAAGGLILAGTAAASLLLGPGADRRRLERAARDPAAFVRLLKRTSPSFEALFRQRLPTLEEGYTLEEYAIQAVGRRRLLRPAADLPALLATVFERAGEAAVPARDMGPGELRRARRQASVDLLGGLLTSLGSLPAEVRGAQALIGADLAAYFEDRGEPGPDLEAARARVRAAAAGLPPGRFLRERAYPFYLASVAARTRAAGGLGLNDSLFEATPRGGLRAAGALERKALPLLESFPAEPVEAPGFWGGAWESVLDASRRVSAFAARVAPRSRPAGARRREARERPAAPDHVHPPHVEPAATGEALAAVRRLAAEVARAGAENARLARELSDKEAALGLDREALSRRSGALAEEAARLERLQSEIERQAAALREAKSEGAREAEALLAGIARGREELARQAEQVERARAELEKREAARAEADAAAARLASDRARAAEEARRAAAEARAREAATARLLKAAQDRIIRAGGRRTRHVVPIEVEEPGPGTLHLVDRDSELSLLYRVRGGNAAAIPDDVLEAALRHARRFRRAVEESLRMPLESPRAEPAETLLDLRYGSLRLGVSAEDTLESLRARRPTAAPKEEEDVAPLEPAPAVQPRRDPPPAPASSAPADRLAAAERSLAAKLKGLPDGEAAEAPLGGEQYGVLSLEGRGGERRLVYRPRDPAKLAIDSFLAQAAVVHAGVYGMTVQVRAGSEVMDVAPGTRPQDLLAARARARRPAEPAREERRIEYRAPAQEFRDTSPIWKTAPEFADEKSLAAALSRIAGRAGAERLVTAVMGRRLMVARPGDSMNEVLLAHVNGPKVPEKARAPAGGMLAFMIQRAREELVPNPEGSGAAFSALASLSHPEDIREFVLEFGLRRPGDLRALRDDVARDAVLGGTKGHWDAALLELGPR